MASNSFGNFFKILTWGESHGKAIGVVIDGCPAGISLDDTHINQELQWRAPGKNPYTSPRNEADQAEILSGVFEGKTTGAPISIMIRNSDQQSQHYGPVKDLLRPGHANYTYLEKYGCFDYRGGGRASGRETACRVAAGAVAKQLLSDVGVVVISYVRAIGSIHGDFTLSDVAGQDKELRERIRSSSLYCPDEVTTKRMKEELNAIQERGDSLGGLVEAVAFNVPVGWGDPIYEKLEANLAKAMLSIPATKGFEIGSGFDCVAMEGSRHNDLFISDEGEVKLASNEAGGTLAGISTGMPIMIRVPFKPSSSIRKNQTTVNLKGESELLTLPEGSRHDPCIAIRAVPVVEAMFALVLVDAMLMNRSAKR